MVNCAATVALDQELFGQNDVDQNERPKIMKCGHSKSPRLFDPATLLSKTNACFQIQQRMGYTAI